MEFAYRSTVVVSALLFFHYGMRCLFAHGMAEEFHRFGLTRFRRLTGSLEVLGALGLLAGLVFPPLMLAASGGLAVLMMLGVFTRLRVRDPLLEVLPAAILLVANLFLFIHAWGLLSASA